MPKLIAAINMTLDGFCDHTSGIADDGLHQHYNELLGNAGTILYGRITYQLMESSWPAIVKKPTGNKPMDDFAVLMDNIPKIVYSRTLQKADWKNSEMKREIVREEILKLKAGPGKPVLAGSRSVIIALMKLGLVDEFQLCVHPVIAGSGLPLFGNMKDRTLLKLIRTKSFSAGQVVLYYEPAKSEH